jgi:ferrous iron transport protein A
MPKKSIPISLQEIPEGEAVRVVALDGAEELGTRLREMGFCEQAVVRRVSGRSHIVCQVCGSKVALNRAVAGRIRVERLDCDL